MKIIQSEMSINDFIDHVEKQTKDFEEHVHPAGDVLWVFVEPGNVVP